MGGFMRKGLGFVVIFLAFGLTGCATANGPAPQSTSASGLSAGHMRLSAQMSSSIFLQPVAPQERTVFVDGHNTSSAQSLGFSRLIKERLLAKGYHLTNNPNVAHYMLMYNIRYVGKETHSNAANGALAGGFGGAVMGAAANNSQGALAGGIIGAGIGSLIGAVMSNNRYMMVVDIQVEERDRGAYASTSTIASQGTNSTMGSYGGGVSGWMIYRDRIVAQAHGLRLRFSYAVPALSHEVAGELAGIF